MGNIGAPELLIILGVLVLIFGSTQLPKLARSIGQAQKEFKSGLKEGASEDDDEGKPDEGKPSKGKSSK
ncbi:MAG: twin-arginine translocase TatA/TatE family subunit [Acidimicrobiia bacterium]